ncbi:hypothetical protein CAPTEDRAFT_226304 [Capitella teleta]|uniref:Methyltransferase domain-containing protein n=1 Tax=Capitella teleta TaxID=283909 RepID=R7UF40_CAPTE|nr:hypothetical protein CAPTEDRAFT_226304 [Capitella teleta]|eukprot:ELU02403.1 hypothetical protein CAPTEDRAFT_226304 [Capitella teleta]
MRSRSVLGWVVASSFLLLLLVKLFISSDKSWPLYLDDDAYFFGGDGSQICNPRQSVEWKEEKKNREDLVDAIMRHSFPIQFGAWLNLNVHRRALRATEQKILLCERKRDQLFDGLQKVEAQELIHRVMTKSTIRCREMQMFGIRGHGGYEACMDAPFGLEQDNCLVYSFGYSNGYSFEEAIIQEYGCEVHTFDPMVDFSVKEELGLQNWTLHDVGIWGDDFENTEGQKMRRLATIVRMLGHENRVIDLIKMDSQGAEWPFFRDLAIHHASLENVKQFVLKANAPRRKPKNQVMRMSDYSQVFRSISLVTKLGFRRYHFHAADMSQSCCNWWADLVHPTPNLYTIVDWHKLKSLSSVLRSLSDKSLQHVKTSHMLWAIPRYIQSERISREQIVQRRRVPLQVSVHCITQQLSDRGSQTPFLCACRSGAFDLCPLVRTVLFLDRHIIGDGMDIAFKIVHFWLFVLVPCVDCVCNGPGMTSCMADFMKYQKSLSNGFNFNSKEEFDNVCQVFLATNACVSRETDTCNSALLAHWFSVVDAFDYICMDSTKTVYLQHLPCLLRVEPKTAVCTDTIPSTLTSNASEVCRKFNEGIGCTIAVNRECGVEVANLFLQIFQKSLAHSFSVAGCVMNVTVENARYMAGVAPRDEAGLQGLLLAALLLVFIIR